MWSYFIDTAFYLQRYTPSSATNGKTPWELFYSSVPNISHLREIGCDEYGLILNKHNPKVFERSKRCTMVGYSALTKGSYLLYHPESDSVIDTIHVRFVESHQAFDIPSFFPPTDLTDENIDGDGFSRPDEGE